ncbi:MAG: Trk system potassium transporter TrkA [Eubacteriales bacterium]|nr:Trk system potassium transporter TrkA [Eubacteriales bacterium]
MDITIVGAGKLGTELAKSLSNEEHNVTVVDTNSQKLSTLVDKYDIQAVCGSGTHIDVMKEAFTDRPDLVISTTHSDENNILVCLIAKKLGAKNTIARVRNPEYNAQFEFMRNELGISFMINPDFSAALEISRIIQFPDVSNVETFANGHIDMAEYKISEGSALCGKSISSISIGRSNNMLICAVERGDEVFIPNGDFVLQAKDRIHITGKHKELASIGKKISILKKHSLKNVMIIGCSRTAVYLADMLTAMGKNVVIIEKDLEQCKNLFDMVPNATVINGDANDHDFLLSEGLEKMDAVVTLTDIDETNFLVSLYADKLGVSKTVTKINNNNLTKMLYDIGLDAIVNVSDISVSTITQYVRARENVSSSYMKTLYKLVGGQVEAAEFLAGDYVKFLKTPLSKLKIKKNVLVAAINRKNETIFPGGNDYIDNGDLVVVVSKDKRVKDLNDILQ